MTHPKRRRDLAYRHQALTLLLCGKCGRRLLNLNQYTDDDGRSIIGGSDRPTWREVRSWGGKTGRLMGQSEDIVVDCHPRRCGARYLALQPALVEAYGRANRERRNYVVIGDGRAAIARGGRDL